ncbi:MAG: hypothetical protein ACLGH0_14140 [Thermoanaerobaculia bacterium]
MHQRITLVARCAAKPDIDWKYVTRSHAHRVAFLDSVAALKAALGSALQDVGLDVERVVVDRSGTAEEFLDLLTAVPAELNGDILFIRDDGSGILSATGRGGDRVLYALTTHDIRFYLETHDLVTGRVALELSA